MFKCLYVLHVLIIIIIIITTNLYSTRFYQKDMQSAVLYNLQIYTTYVNMNLNN